MKVLIISHLPVATQNNMGKTFLSLFSKFDREELCQLYIYPAIPDVDRCSSFYRVTDKDVLRWFYTLKRPGGEVPREKIHQTQGLYEEEKDESFYRNRRNKSPVRRLLRDTMWSLSAWYNDDLARWLDREAPTCIFLAPGVAKFIYDIALRIGDERGIPIVSYICDEYYFVKQPKSKLDQLRLGLLKAKIEKLMGRSRHLMVICDELKELYSNTFDVPATTLMTGTSYPMADVPALTEQPGEICYFGNIRCNRYVSLREVGRELDAINRDRGTNFKLKIYTSEKDPEILGCFRDIASVELCGFLTGAAFEQAFHDARLLLHVEAFDEDSIDFVQHSVSTKIADSLASGIPLLAYGPSCVSSMKHLMRHECAITATDQAELRTMLETALFDGNARKTAAENGLRTARKYHDSDRTGALLREIISEISEK